MFIIELTYKVDTAILDENMNPHIAFLEKYYHSGHFIASGRKEPRDGGIILVKSTDRKEVEAIVAEDPFNTNGFADYRIIEFRPTKKVKGFDLLFEEEQL